MAAHGVGQTDPQGMAVPCRSSISSVAVAAMTLAADGMGPTLGPRSTAAIGYRICVSLG